MHEYSIVTSLLDLCKENAKKEGAAKIIKVEVKIGKLSGVEPYLLKSAFEAFKEGTICQNAEFIMNIQEVVLFCNNCNKQFEIHNFEMRCPSCDSISVDIVDGKEMYLMSLEME